MTTITIPEIEQLQLQRMPFAKLEQGCWTRGIKVGAAIADLTPYLLEVHKRLSRPGYRSDLAPKGLTWTRWCEENRDQLGMAPSTIRALISTKQPALSSAEVPVTAPDISMKSLTSKRGLPGRDVVDSTDAVTTIPGSVVKGPGPDNKAVLKEFYAVRREFKPLLTEMKDIFRAQSCDVDSHNAWYKNSVRSLVFAAATGSQPSSRQPTST
jgi:hypothetical protein